MEVGAAIPGPMPQKGAPDELSFYRRALSISSTRFANLPH